MRGSAFSEARLISFNAVDVVVFKAVAPDTICLSEDMELPLSLEILVNVVDFIFCLRREYSVGRQAAVRPSPDSIMLQ